jgi:hypothetical protein
MLTLNPMLTSNSAGLFGAQTIGKVAGCLYPKPNARFNLRAGTIAASVTGLVYAGVAISAALASQANQSVGAQQGPQLTLATALANFAGFAVADQSFAGIMTPQSTVPLFSPGMSISFVEPGSESVIALPISAANAANLLSASQYTQLSWDFTNEVVIPYTGAGANAGAIPGGGPGGVAKILEVFIGNSYVVEPNLPVAGQAEYSPVGSVVILEI